jgi:acetyl esterase/lipase
MPSSEFARAKEMFAGLFPEEELTVDRTRSILTEWQVTNFPVTTEATVEEVDAGGVPGRWITTDDKGAVVLYLHGGGYVIGDTVGYADLAQRVTASVGKALAIDYRRAPEAPFPAAVDDAVAAYRWLSGRVDPTRIAVAGDSAGAGLALALLLRLRELGEPLPAATVAISPWTDLTLASESLERNADADPVLTREALQAWSDLYADGQDPLQGLISPAYADLSGLPPIMVLVGSADVLEDDGRRFTDAARAAEVEVEFLETEGMLHVWPMFPFLPETRSATAAIADFLGRHIDLPG